MLCRLTLLSHLLDWPRKCGGKRDLCTPHMGRSTFHRKVRTTDFLFRRWASESVYDGLPSPSMGIGKCVRRTS
jgi:hypothetical protein